MSFKCIKCHLKIPSFPIRNRCSKCGSALEYFIDLSNIGKKVFSGKFNFWRYKTLLPPVENRISLGEGGTLLHRAERLAVNLGLKNLYLKDETRNPTNSFRDRAAALLTSNIIDLNQQTLICATNGNLGASLAAYSAKLGLTCHLIVPRLVDMGKLAQMLVYNSIIEEYGETIDDSIKQAEILADETGWYQATAELNPFVIEAQKTIAFEIYEQLGIPDWFAVSMGSGGNIYALWKGFKELKALGIIDSLPKFIGVQPEGCSPIVNTFLNNKNNLTKNSEFSTRALGVLVNNPLQLDLALKAIKESNGITLTVSDLEIINAELQIAKLEGIFAEPASSATLAALNKLIKQKRIRKDDKIVCLITGSGLKTTDILQALNKKHKTTLGTEISTKGKILHLLRNEDNYGYDLWKKLGKTMTRTAIYQHLNELKDKGLIVKYSQKGRNFFKLTQRGKRVLKAINDLKILI